MLNVSWDPVLIAISYLVAFIASFVALDSAGKIPLASCKAALFWRMAGGVTLGIGIWSMHFIGMLSMKMPMIMSYHLWLTVGSLGIAVVASTLAINIAVPANRFPLSTDPRHADPQRGCRFHALCRHGRTNAEGQHYLGPKHCPLIGADCRHRVRRGTVVSLPFTGKA